MFQPEKAHLANWSNLGLGGNASWLAAGYHINQSIWEYHGVGGVCTNRWVETGLTLGFHGNPYYQYYAAGVDAAGYSDLSLGIAVQDNSSHSYKVEQQISSSSAVYAAFRDGNLLVSYAGQNPSGSCVAQAGLEVSGSPDGNSSAANFDVTPLKYKNTSGTWHTGWASTSELWIDNPCGAGYSPPNCLNGAYYGTNRWQDNKP